MAYKEEKLTRGTIKITDPDTGLSETGAKSDRANMQKRLAAKIAKGAKTRKKLGTVTEKHKGEGTGKSPSAFTSAKPTNIASDKKKLGAKQKQYPASTMPSPVGGKKEKKEKKLNAAQLAKRGKSAVKKKGPAKMTGTYGPDSGEQSWTDIIKKAWQEANRDGQPDDEATTGVEKTKKEIAKRTPTVAQALTPDPEAEKIEEEYEQQFLSDEALRQQFGQHDERPKWLQDIVEDPTKLTGGQKPAWWPEGKEKMGEGVQTSGGIRRKPGESLLEFNKRLEKMNLTEEQLEGTIGDEDFADQKVLDAQIDEHIGDKRKSKKLDTSSLSDERDEKIQELFEAKDPEAELIASEYEAQAAIKDAQERRAKLRPERKPPEVVKPKVVKPTTPMAEGDLEEQESQALQQSDAQAKENNEISQKIKKISEENFDLEANQTEIKKLTKKLSKEDTAQVKEQASPNWYVDPWTGFALDLNVLKKRADRKDAMEMAALLPAYKRAMYLYQEKLIEKEDLDKLIEPSEKEKLARKLTEMQLLVASSDLLLKNKKLKNYTTPDQQEWHKSYRNAVTNDDFEGIYTFGRKLNLSERELKRIVEGHKKAGLAKASKKETDAFKSRFNISYSKVWDSRQKVMMESAKVFEEGEAGGMMNFMGQRYSGRKGLLEDNGLFEIEGARALGTNELAAYFANLPDATMFDEPRWKTPEGKPDYAKMLNSPAAYQRLLQKNLIYRHMDTLTNGQYDSMEQYRAELQKRDESINQHLVSP